MYIGSHNRNQKPLILFVAKSVDTDSLTYDNGEGYSHKSEKIEYGTYFLGSPKKNTRCNKFTLLGADATHSDDTKEK